MSFPVTQKLTRISHRISSRELVGCSESSASRRSADDGVLKHSEVDEQGRCLRRCEIHTRSKNLVRNAG